jgi:hypothetical protein
MNDELASDPSAEQQQQRQQQQAIQLEPALSTPQQPIHPPVAQDTDNLRLHDYQMVTEAVNDAEAFDTSAAAAAAAGSTVAAPDTEVLVSCQGLQALLFLDPSFPRGLAKPNWLVRCFCSTCQQKAGPDG